MKLEGFKVNEKYLEAVAKDFANKDLQVKIADWIQLTPNSGNYSNAIEIDSDA